MELIIIIVTIIAIIVIYSMMNVKIKELKAIALNKELNEIAKKLFVSVNTVKTILKTVFKKLCIKSRQEIKDVLKSQNNN